jgi:integrase
MIGYDKQRKTYFVQVKYRDPYTNKQKTILRRGFKLKREAVELEAKLKLEKSNNSISNTSMTFKEVAKIWEETIESSDTSKRHHKEHFEKRFSDLYEKPIRKITKEMLIEWKNQLGQTSYATKTKNTCISYVRSVFKFASEIYGIQNVSVVLKNFKNTQEEIMLDMNVWSLDEFNLFIESVDNELYKIFFSTLFWTGARRGEIIALQCNDLIEEEKSIYIHGSQRDMDKGIKSTKTGNKRYVRLDDVLFEQLFKLKKYYKTGYLFGGNTSVTRTTIDRYFAKGIEKSGVKKIRLHDLRHSHATMLINAGVNIVAVSKRLGHSDINQTLKTYTHLLKDTDDKMMEYINSKHARIK